MATTRASGCERDVWVICLHARACAFVCVCACVCRVAPAVRPQAAALAGSGGADRMPPAAAPRGQLQACAVSRDSNEICQTDALPGKRETHLLCRLRTREAGWGRWRGPCNQAPTTLHARTHARTCARQFVRHIPCTAVNVARAHTSVACACAGAVRGPAAVARAVVVALQATSP